MNTRPFLRAAIQLAICASVLSGCANIPKSDSILDQTGQAQVAPIGNFHLVDTVASKAMYRGAQPSGDAQWKYLSGLGVKTVLKLNQYAGAQSTVEEERLAAEKYGIRLVPVFMPPEDLPHGFNPWSAPDDAQIKSALAVMEDSGNWPLYIHCSHGHDRTGLLVAMYRIRQNNYCKDKAFAEMKSNGHNMLLPGLRKTLYREDIAQNASCIK